MHFVAANPLSTRDTHYISNEHTQSRLPPPLTYLTCA